MADGVVATVTGCSDCARSTCARPAARAEEAQTLRRAVHHRRRCQRLVPCATVRLVAAHAAQLVAAQLAAAQLARDPKVARDPEVAATHAASVARLAGVASWISTVVGHPSGVVRHPSSVVGHALLGHPSSVGQGTRRVLVGAHARA